jgi:hypothetical protein
VNYYDLFGNGCQIYIKEAFKKKYFHLFYLCLSHSGRMKPKVFKNANTERQRKSERRQYMPRRNVMYFPLQGVEGGQVM